jgi:dCTP deaminase
MILTDKEILTEVENGNIVVDPFDQAHLGTKSYDGGYSKLFHQKEGR